MKMSRRILVITICVLLLLSISLVSFAIPVGRLMPLFSKMASGYRCDGYAGVLGKVASASLTATMIEDEMHIPPEDCSSSISIEAYKGEESLYGSSTYYGDAYVSATFNAPGNIHHAKCSYKFHVANLGEYTVYPS